MDPLFLNELPAVSLTEGKTKAFIADFPEPRPSFEHIKRWVEEWRAQIDERVPEVMKRKNSAVSRVQVLVDQHGFLLIACFKHPVILGAAKTALHAIFRCMPKEATDDTAEEGLRPLDEADADRIRTWQTTATLRPKGKKRAREESDDKTEVVRFVKPRQELVQKKAEPAKKTAVELLAELSDASSSEEEVPPPRLMLTNGPTEANDYSDPDFHGPHQGVGTPCEERGSACRGRGR